MAVVQLIAAMAKHEVPRGQWPELLRLLHSLITSSSPTDQDLAMFTMSVLTDTALDIFSGQADQFVSLFTQTAAVLDNLTTVVGFYTVLTMTNVLPLCETDTNLRNVYSKSIPKILKALPQLSAQDEERACQVLDLFCEILSSAVSLIVSHMTQLVQLCLELARNKQLGPVLRDKAMLLLGMSARAKKKLLVKLGLVKPMVEGVFLVMCEPPEDGEEEEDDWFCEQDNESPFQSATSVLGTLAIHLPPNNLLQCVVALVTAGLQEESPHIKKACYLALATVTEGASECIRNKYLQFFLECVCAGITSTCSIVRNAALFALGQLSEHLQPEISQHALQLMPILLEYLTHLCSRLRKGSQEPPGLYSMFYALVAFCENMEEKLVPYLPELMSRLVEMVDPCHSVVVQEQSLDAVGSVASAVGPALLPYLPTILPKLNIYLLQQHTEETACLQVQALQTLSLLARTLGAEHFGPLAEETMVIGLKLLEGSEDPDLKAALYSLFASLSTVMKEQSAVFLPRLIDAMNASLKSTDGFVPHYKEDKGSVFPVFEDLSDTEDEEDIEGQSEGSDDEPVELTVENPYMEEKEEACLALKEFASQTGDAFLPFLETSYKTVFELTSYTYDDVKKASFEAIAQLCVSFSRLTSPEGASALKDVLLEVVAKCIETVEKDEEIVVVNAAMEAIGTMLKEIGAPVLQEESHLEQILKTVSGVLSSQTACQDKGDDEGEEAEQDELLMETAGEVLPALGHALAPSQFLSALHTLLNAHISKLVQQGSVSQRSFFIGTLAECMAPAGPELERSPEVALLLLRLFQSLAGDPSYEVRNNAIFGLGELVAHSKQALYSEYMSLLILLSEALAKERTDGVIDNICGAIARLISTNSDLVPIQQVLPVLLEKLPLREDHEEHGAVLRCLGMLYQRGDPVLRAHIPQLITISCSIVDQQLGKQEVIRMGVELLQRAGRDFPAELQAVLQSLSPNSAANISNLISSFT